MLQYALRSVVEVILSNWHGKSFSQRLDMTQTSDLCHMYLTPLTLKLKISEKSKLKL